jgi:hypothetical protein
MNADSYIAFADSMDRIRTKSSADTYLNQLLFANVITAFEFYLQTIAVGLMNHDALLVKKVAETNLAALWEHKHSMIKAARLFNWQ